MASLGEKMRGLLQIQRGQRAWYGPVGVVVALLLSVAAAGAMLFDTNPDLFEGTDGTGMVRTLASDEAGVYVGGSFTSYEGTAQPYLASVDPDTGAVRTQFAPQLDGTVEALQLSADGLVLYAGGSFRNANGLARRGVVALDPVTGQTLPGFDVRLSGTVHDLYLDGDDLYLAGGFWWIADSARDDFARVDALTGELDPLFAPQAGGGFAYAIRPAPDGTHLYVGGTFSTINNVPGTEAVAMVRKSDGVVNSAFDSPNTYPVFALQVDTDRNRVLAAVGGPGGRAQIYDATSGALLTSIYADGDVQDVLISGGDYYFAGHFWEEFGNTTPIFVARVDGESLQPDPDWRVDLRSNGLGAWTLMEHDHQLYVGGELHSGHPLGGRGVVRFSADAVEALPTLPPVPTATPSPPPTATPTPLPVEPTPSPTPTPEPIPPTPTVPPAPTELFASGSSWRWTAAQPSDRWVQPSYDAAGWETGDGRFGSGEGDENTLLPNQPVIWFRRNFQVAAPTDLVMRVLADDGYVIHINGVELHRANVPAGPVNAHTAAIDYVWGNAERAWTDVVVPASMLVGGDNVVTVTLHNAPGSKDQSFDAALAAR